MMTRIFSLLCLLFWGFSIVLSLAQADSLLVDQLLEEATVGSQESKEGRLQRAYDLSVQANYASGQQRSLSMLAEFARQNRNIAGALRYYLEALNLAEKKGQDSVIRRLRQQIGDVYQTEGLFSAALPYYLKSLDPVDWGAPTQDSLKYKIGMSYASLLKPDSTFYYLSGLSVWSKNSPEFENEQLGLLHQVVSAYSKAGDYEKALPYNQRILDKMSSTNRPDDEMAVIYNNLGYNHNQLGNYLEAARFFEQSIDLQPLKDHRKRALHFTNAGIAYFNAGQLRQALTALQNARKNYQVLGELETSPINHLLSNIYLKSEDLYNAQTFNTTAINNAKAHSQLFLLSDAYYTAAQIHADLYEYETALTYYQKYFLLRDSLEEAQRLDQIVLEQEQRSLEKAERDIRNLLINQEIQQLTIRQLTLEGEKQQLALDNLQLEADQQEKELQLLKQEQEVSETRLRNQELLAQQSKQALQIAQQKLLAEQQDRALADLAQKEQLQTLEIQRQEAQLAQEAQRVELLTKDNEINQLELEKQSNFRQFAYGLGALMLVVLGLIFAGFVYSRFKNRQLAKKNTEIEAQKEEIIQERNKSENLLLNILPASTAQELKEKGVAQPRRYENATVLFSDFVNFTSISSQMPPEELVNELNHCFRQFDTIVEKHGLEKIKTIGDAYMCVGGLPEEDPFNPQQAARAAMEMMAFIQERYEEKKKLGQVYWQMRIGLHTGPVVAGVVGHKKFVYDIWGDTVNTASRIESSSDPGRINLSASTFEMIHQDFSCVPRGKIVAKNKGEMDMYYLVEKI